MKQSIVNWLPWKGVNEVPENTRLILKVESGVVLAGFFYRPIGERRLMQSTGQEHKFLDHPQTTHYALASDLERDTELKDKGDIRELLDNLKVYGAPTTIPGSAEVQDDRRIRWLVEQAVVISASQPDMSCPCAMAYVIGIESEARAQVERERNEGGHE